MRKFLLTTLLGIISFGLFAQQDLDDVQEKIEKGKYDEAKQKIDKYLSSEKNAKKADGWYYKAIVYNNIAKDEKYKDLSADPRGEAFEAYKKYVELDPKQIMGTLGQNVTLFDLFYTYNQIAVDAFNAKDFDRALENFKKAQVVEDFIVAKNFSYNGTFLPKFDTSLVLNSAASAIQAKKTDEAVTYYAKIADNKIVGKDYVEVYEFLVNHYHTKGDMVNRDKYLAIGKELYPDNNYWIEIQLPDTEDKAVLFAKYDELTKSNPTKQFLFYNYGAELFNYLYTGEKRPADYTEKQAKLEEVLKGAIAIQPTIENNLLLARHYYNLTNDLQDKVIAIKGTKPEDVKKKNDLKAEINPKLEELLKHATYTYDALDAKTGLKPGELGNMKIAANLVLYYHEMKGNKEKIKEWQDKMKAI